MEGWGTTRPMMFATPQPQRHTLRLPVLGLVLAGLTLGTGGSAAQAKSGCTASPEAARTVAKSAAEDTLSSRVALYRLMYDDIRYGVSVGQARVSGDKTQVTGTINLHGKERLSGRVVDQTFRGVVFLAKNGCNWQATGYEQS